tara:strand:+ start:392 stop:793 length:402 start_codon:yes stop_codon:yes gene_type:complete
MSRALRRAQQKVGNRLQKKNWDRFKDVTIEERELVKQSEKLKGHHPDQVFKNNKYIVQIFHDIKRKGSVYTRVMVRRSDAKAIYSWQDLYRIKNEIFGEEIEAIQFMPPKSELIDAANLYWFFIEQNQLKGEK